ncbi:MAG: UbiA family prenyltransferase [Candidatus Cloacimonetes bacterium]|nr:UbiA family prenyltransferase [Candidatus Cloacimonadota bacterium]
MIKILKLVKLQHALFALPLTVASSVLASQGLPHPVQCFWVLVAFLMARSLGMAMNRLLDRGIDAKNPRTSHRLMAKGDLGVKALLPWLFGFLFLFVLACTRLHPLALKLFPVCLVLLLVYPMAKRFTVLAHVILGCVLALGPIGAWVGLAGWPSEGILWFGLGVVFWVTGFDILYALQDEEFDRQEGLFSIPARFGGNTAKKIAAVSHLLVPLIWTVAFNKLGLSNWTVFGNISIFVLLLLEHILIQRGLEKNISLAFFKLNISISLLVMLIVLVDVFL